MKPISKLTIGQFRCISDMVLDDLGDINIIVGDNNIGKTSILEAINCWSSPNDVSSFMNTARSRLKDRRAMSPGSNLDALVSLFPYSKSETSIKLSATIFDRPHEIEFSGIIEKRIFQERARSRKFASSDDEIMDVRDSAPDYLVEIESDCFVGVLAFDNNATDVLVRSDMYAYKNVYNPFLPLYYVSPAHHFVNPATENDLSNNEDILELLRLFDNQIVKYGLDFSNRRFPRELIQHEKYGVVPLFTFGDGLKRALSLASYVSKAKNGILLVDEIDTSIHVSALSKTFKWLIDACNRFSIQLFATTHSLDAIKGIIDIASEDMRSDLAVFRIERFNEKHYVKRYSEKTLKIVVSDMGHDVR